MRACARASDFCVCVYVFCWLLVLAVCFSCVFLLGVFFFVFFFCFFFFFCFVFCFLLGVCLFLLGVFLAWCFFAWCFFGLVFVCDISTLYI